MSKVLNGVGIGVGVVISKAKVLPEVVFKYEEKSSRTSEEELKLLKNTCNVCHSQILDLAKTATKTMSEEKGEIFKAHALMIQDEVILQDMEELVKKGYTQEFAIANIFDKNIESFSQMEDKYFKERASDLSDIKRRLLMIALGIKMPDLMLIKESCILIAHDLTPSETVLLNPQYVKGFVTNIGGATSHAAIMAKTLGIPAIVSTKSATKLIKDAEDIALDIRKGEVHHKLNANSVEIWNKKQEEYKDILEDLEEYKDIECFTKDKIKVNLLGNIGHPKDVSKVVENGGRGVGLFRSEFLYMESSQWPTEEEQYVAYKQSLEGVDDDSSVTIRTLDIGGDKHLNYYTFPEELNPFLGYRALRMSLKETDIFKTQLRALARASCHGNLKIMFPMVTTIEEFLDARKLALEIFEELKLEGIALPPKLNIGMMIEIPSSALMADKFAEYADFFSIGSNDLIQYTHAVDRMSEGVNYLYQPNSPGILRLIAMAADAANHKNISISVCGEMASLPKCVPILIGLGISNLSMSAVSIPIINRIISLVKMSDCKELAKKALNLSTEKEVNDMIDEYFNQNNIVY